MAGVFVIVGPSGAGKDTLMESAQARLPGVHLVRRVITRPEAAGGEDFEGVTRHEFKRRCTAGGFALHWQAHGLSYGIPVNVADVLGSGRTVLFNGSRTMLTEAARVFPDPHVIHVIARRDVLATRLAARGRESVDDVKKRLDRAELPLPDGLNITTIDNSGALEAAVQKVLDVLQPVRA